MPTRMITKQTKKNQSQALLAFECDASVMFLIPPAETFLQAPLLRALDLFDYLDMISQFRLSCCNKRSAST